MKEYKHCLCPVLHSSCSQMCISKDLRLYDKVSILLLCSVHLVKDNISNLPKHWWTKFTSVLQCCKSICKTVMKTFHGIIHSTWIYTISISIHLPLVKECFIKKSKSFRILYSGSIMESLKILTVLIQNQSWLELFHCLSFSLTFVTRLPWRNTMDIFIRKYQLFSEEMKTSLLPGKNVLFTYMERVLLYFINCFRLH